MWGAAAHAVIAIRQQRGWRHRSQRDMSEAVGLVSDELREAGDASMATFLLQGFVIVSNYHIHFYNRDMDENGGGG